MTKALARSGSWRAARLLLLRLLSLPLGLCQRIVPAALAALGRRARRRRVRRAAVLRFGTDVLVFADLSHLVQRLVAAARRLLDMRAELWMADGSDPAPLPVDVLLAAGEQVLVLEQLRASRRHPEVAAALERARLDGCALLRCRSRLVGVLMLRAASRGGHLEEDQLDALSVLATQAAFAIENLRLQEELGRSLAMVEQAGRLASLGLLTAGFAHELRGPLVPIRTFAQLLPERWGDADFRRDFGAMVLSEVDRVGGLIDDLLRVAGVPPVSREPASLEDVVRSIMPLLVAQAKIKGVEIEFGGARTVPNIPAQVEHIQHAAIGLVLSAIEATPAGGCVRIVTGQKDGADSNRAFLRVGELRRGAGPQSPAYAFDPASVSDGKTVLGLAVARQIVCEHGGTLEVENLPGHATSFTIEMPTTPRSPLTALGGGATDRPGLAP